MAHICKPFLRGFIAISARKLGASRGGSAGGHGPRRGWGRSKLLSGLAANETIKRHP